MIEWRKKEKTVKFLKRNLKIEEMFVSPINIKEMENKYKIPVLL